APVLALVRGRAPLDRHAAVRPAVAGQAGPAHGLRGDQGHGVGQGVLHAADQQFRGPGAPVAAPAGYGVFDTRSVASPCSSVRGGIVVKRTSLLALLLVPLVGVATLAAQQRQITGRVTAAQTSELVAGVTVTVTGTAFAAVTNADGRYAGAAPAGQVRVGVRPSACESRGAGRRDADPDPRQQHGYRVARSFVRGGWCAL